MRTNMLALVAVTLGLLSCGGKSPGATLSFPATALQTVTTDGRTFSVAIRASPQPPGLGESNFEYTVTDGTGATVDGLKLGVTPWMPQMGHGTSVTPAVKGIGGGVYQITNVYLFMSGEWQLRTTLGGQIDGGTVSDTMAPVFQIP